MTGGEWWVAIAVQCVMQCVMQCSAVQRGWWVVGSLDSVQSHEVRILSMPGERRRRLMRDGQQPSSEAAHSHRMRDEHTTDEV